MSRETFLLCWSLALGTFLSEDAACVSGGVLDSQGKLTLTAAIIACAIGIFVSDLAIVFAGRATARGWRAGWLRWLQPSDAKLGVARQWFQRHGLWVIVASRFLPGTRSATCFSAGALEVPLRRFIPVFLLASALWTPVAVGLAYHGGNVLNQWWADAGWWLVAAGAVAILALMALAQLAWQLSTPRGRRLARAKLHRTTHFEFWPWWALYLPVMADIAFHLWPRFGLMSFSATNPAIPLGGLFGESKSEILQNLGDNGGAIARWTLLPGEGDRLGAVNQWMTTENLAWPIVLKPDIGERGTEVAIARTPEAAAAYLAAHPGKTIAQAYIEGEEFGVFYLRHPAESRGRVISITGKTLTTVIGDGHRTLEQLILSDARAVLMAEFYFKTFAHRLAEIPAAGETVRLAAIGNHCRGAVFLDRNDLHTPALEAAIDRIAQNFSGFYLGRFDLRCPSAEHLQRGDGLKILELNGVAAEQGHIYDPVKITVWRAWATMLRQWRTAYAIGAENIRRGAKPATLSDFIREWKRHR